MQGGEVHGHPAALAVEGARHEEERARVDVGGDLEVVAGAEAGYVEVEGAGFGEGGEVSEAHGVAGVGIGQRGPEGAARDLGAVAGAPDAEGAGGPRVRHHGQLGPRRQVADLVDLDPFADRRAHGLVARPPRRRPAGGQEH